MARPLVLLALLWVALGVSGVEPRLPWFTPVAPLPPQVRARSIRVVARAGAGLPAGELAYLAANDDGTLLVTDRRRRTVTRLDVATGQVRAEWGPQLAPGVVLAEPAGVVEANGITWVLDRGTPRLFGLDTEGRLQATIPLEPFGPYGLNGLAADRGLLYAADTGRNRLLVLTPSGRLVRQVGQGGTGLGQFTQPMALSFVPGTSTMWVADWENARVQRFELEPEVRPTDAWSTGFRPFGVAADAVGRVWVPDPERRRVQAFARDGTLLGEVGGAGSPSLDVRAPAQLAFGPAADGGPLYVLGVDGVLRVDIEEVAAPARTATAQSVDVASLLGLGLLALSLVLLAFGRWRRSGPRVSPPHTTAPERTSS